MKNKKIIVAAFAFCITAFGCNSTEVPDKPAVSAKPEMIQPIKDSALFANVKFDSKWDLSCGMPISAGLEDTAHYKGKIYGFCSKECKDAFVKDPVTAIKSKK